MQIRSGMLRPLVLQELAGGALGRQRVLELHIEFRRPLPLPPGRHGGIGKHVPPLQQQGTPGIGTVGMGRMQDPAVGYHQIPRLDCQVDGVRVIPEGCMPLVRGFVLQLLFMGIRQLVVQVDAVQVGARNDPQAAVVGRGVDHVVRQENLGRPRQTGLGVVPDHAVLVPVEGGPVSRLAQDQGGVAMRHVFQAQRVAHLLLHRVVQELVRHARVEGPTLLQEGALPAQVGVDHLLVDDREVAALEAEAVGDGMRVQEIVDEDLGAGQGVPVQHAGNNAVAVPKQLVARGARVGTGENGITHKRPPVRAGNWLDLISGRATVRQVPPV